MWALILTIVSWSTATGTSMTNVPGFTDEKACMASANAWTKQIAPVLGNYQTVRALCVKTS